MTFLFFKRDKSKGRELKIPQQKKAESLSSENYEFWFFP